MYGLLTALMVAFVELEVAALAAWWPLLETWLGRAVLQSFVAVLTYRWGCWVVERVHLQLSGRRMPRDGPRAARSSATFEG